MVDVDDILLGAVGVLGAIYVIGVVARKDLWHQIIPSVKWGAYALTEPYVMIPSLAGTAVLFHTAKLSGVPMAIGKR